MRMNWRLALLPTCITTAAILLIPGFAPGQSGATWPDRGPLVSNNAGGTGGVGNGYTASLPECVPVTEICDGVDNDCDDVIDDDDPDVVGQPTWYADNDGDSYGDPGNFTQTCTAPFGYVDNSLDCDDMADAINPAASEIAATISMTTATG